MSSDEEMGQEFGEHVVGSFQKALQQTGLMPKPPKPFSAIVCMCITKQYYDHLGRPTVDDYIELNARIDRGR